MQEKYLLAIDQGTTSSRAIVFDTSGTMLHIAQEEFSQIFPENGWVEHNPEEIWSSTLAVCKEACKKAQADGKVLAIGITNQRETTILWNKDTGKPVYNAIVWQDRRTSVLCNTLKKEGYAELIATKTGLLPDPYFSATKITWMLDNVEGTRELAQQGKLAFGTVDCYLLWKLTGGKTHATDASNASRTMLYNIHTGEWDSDLLKLFNIPESILPEVKDCAAHFGDTEPSLLGESIPITGMAGDQQAATIGQCCFEEGMIKSTYGTGCFVMLNTGRKAVTSQHRLLTTVAYRLNGKTTYGLEGSIFVAGAAVQWLRDKIHLINSAKESELLAKSLPDNKGVYLVPAFTGLGAPHWIPEARGAMFGLTRDTGTAEIVRATLESVCYQTHDLLKAMQQDGISPALLRVDGGMIANNWLAQYLADILQLTIERPSVIETAALGASFLAGLEAGVYHSLDDITSRWKEERRFTPHMPQDIRKNYITTWEKAVRLTSAFTPE